MNRTSDEPHATREKCSEQAGYGQTFPRRNTRTTKGFYWVAYLLLPLYSLWAEFPFVVVRCDV